VVCGQFAVVQWETRWKQVWKLQRWMSPSLVGQGRVSGPGRAGHNDRNVSIAGGHWGLTVGVPHELWPASESGAASPWPAGTADPGGPGATLSCAIAETPEGLSVEPQCRLQRSVVCRAALYLADSHSQSPRSLHAPWAIPDLSASAMEAFLDTTVEWSSRCHQCCTGRSPAQKQFPQRCQRGAVWLHNQAVKLCSGGRFPARLARFL